MPKPTSKPTAKPIPGPIFAVVAFDQMSPFHLSVPCITLGDQVPGEPAHTLKVCAAEPGPLRTTAGFEIVARHGIAALRTADTIIVPTWRDPAERPPARLLRELVAAHRRGAQLVGLCLGAYVLAAAGLLDGRKATTHWAYASDFASRYPSVALLPDVLYVEDGTILTSAGSAAGIDCCLHMLRQRYGSEAANKVARRLVVSPHRQGGQTQFVELPIPSTPKDSKLTAMLDWIRANLAQTHTLDALAERSHMSRRTFTRHFRQLTGTTVNAWLVRERLSMAQRLLETTHYPVERVAEVTGFGSAVSMRQHFSRAFGVSPASWRLTFNDRSAASLDR
ncbi:helix-turn-helix domain-containing protein [Pararobbsia silviterrae]|uniref:Helix-turn-helix domain-containing protein n=1 Tax=Pararobbsia silviterrae TaxID=1792498 RepID=A0A494XUT2_9BURK|nr:helix-turn-helix domain-containing protein [Pararobbsia silviterrae]RKP51829.1 helix-turn-helix domain-containing protein [Pararobbsia silviterrae]